MTSALDVSPGLRALAQCECGAPCPPGERWCLECEYEHTETIVYGDNEITREWTPGEGVS